VEVLDLRTGKTRVLHNGSMPSWSASGKQIVYEGRDGIYVMNADGSGVKKIAG
jgi:Tol biopolymer transport system component